MTGGYADAGDAGRRAEQELAAVAEEAGVLLAGPNGQGVVSTPSSLCAQMVAPYPPAGRIGIASQSGNIVSTFENLALSTGVGISRAVSAGNAAVVGVADYLEYFAADPATDVGLAYVEGVRDGRALFDTPRRAAGEQPLVLVQGGSTAGGRRAAASHTGALATDGRIFAGMCRQAGVNLASTVEEAFEAAATFATQPLPRGPTSRCSPPPGDGACSPPTRWRAPSCRCSRCPTTSSPRSTRCFRRAGATAIRSIWPPPRPATPSRRSSSSSPRTTASTRSSSSVRACSRTRRSSCAPASSRRATTSNASSSSTSAKTRGTRHVAADVSAASGKPILVATELAVTDPDNPGPRTVRETGKVCYWSANRVVTAWSTSGTRAISRSPGAIMSVWQRVVATILVIGAVVAVALAFTDDNSASGTTTPASAATPIWSACSLSRNRSSTPSARTSAGRARRRRRW